MASFGQYDMLEGLSRKMGEVHGTKEGTIPPGASKKNDQLPVKDR